MNTARVGAGAWPLLGYLVVVPIAIPAMSQAVNGSSHDVARVAQLFTLLLAALAWMTQSWRSPGGAANGPAWPWLALLPLAVASIALSDRPDMAGRELALAVGCAAAAASTAAALRQRRETLQFVVLVSCSSYALMMAALAFAAVVDGHPLVWQDLAIGYDTYRFFNHVQTVALPLLAWTVAVSRVRSAPWWFGWISLALYAAYVACSGARGTALAVAAATVASVFVLGRGATWPTARNLLLAALLGGILFWVAFILAPSMGVYRLAIPAERSAASLASDSARLELWRLALEQVRASPLLGIGPLHYAHFPNPKAAHPHNVYLQIAAEWGLPILAAALWALWRTLRAMAGAVRVAEPQMAREGAALWIACVAALFDGFVSGNFVMPVSQMWIALAVAWSLAWMRGTRTRAPATPPSSQTTVVCWRWVIPALVLASQTWLLAQAWPEMRDIEAYLAHVHRFVLQNARSNPRFWSDGWF